MKAMTLMIIGMEHMLIPLAPQDYIIIKLILKVKKTMGNMNL
jgi:hypothetical protein